MEPVGPGSAPGRPRVGPGSVVRARMSRVSPILPVLRVRADDRGCGCGRGSNGDAYPCADNGPDAGPERVHGADNNPRADVPDRDAHAE